MTKANSDPNNKKDYVPGKVIYGFFSITLALLGVILGFMIDISTSIGFVEAKLEGKVGREEVREIVREEIELINYRLEGDG